ncbi:MAG TPA: hypothetical protein VLZ07_02930 [Syntrophales bacterium]|nr:hypothetical protein [Syntrophales bacterium]
MKKNLKLLWGLIFILALVVPYVMGVWDDYGYAWVAAAAFALVLILISSRQVKPTFWWRGLWKKKDKAP